MKYDLEQAKVSIGSLKCSGREENCPDGWTKLQSKCYQISTVSADFDDAEASCRRKNAKLAEPMNSIGNVTCRSHTSLPGDISMYFSIFLMKTINSIDWPKVLLRIASGLE